MSSEKPVFQTPNPAELKKAAQEDPIHKREGEEEADVVDRSADEEAEQLGREASAEMANSQTTIANLGGH
ncbi:MAG: hypothetical protein IGS48_14690 [Oscillatoriales cyanobacterium C42_A2020_001]|nr:hypothetical protein [Leptolyngbyaceae cyanobacterium C42_A2020_001]